jgi:PAS domain S-box-containing protein
MERTIQQLVRPDSELLYDAFKASPIGIALESREGRTLFVNPALCFMLGFAEEELCNKHWCDFSPAEDVAKYRAFFDELLAGSRDHYQVEKRFIRKDGSLIWGRVSVFLLNSRPSPLAVAMIEDITDEKRRQDALRESEEKFRSVFRDAGVGMVIVLPEGRFLAANRTFCEYLGYKEEELAGMSVQSVTAPEDWPAFSKRLGEVIRGERGIQRFEKRCLHKSGRIVYTESSAVLIRDCEGAPRYFVGEVLDITKRKEAEEVLSSISRKLIEAQEQERARIARELHDDIGQRLALLAVELDEIPHSNPALPREVVSQIRELKKRTTDLTSDVQTMSHTLHSSKLSLLGLVAAMGSLCKEFGAYQKMEIDFKSHDLPAVVPPEICSTLFRVLQEALQNAAKHSGVKHVEVQLHGVGGEVHLIVQDLGKGFDPRIAMRGVGLGLTSMQERVRLVNGTIRIQSRPMAGTSIHIHVPIMPSEHAAQLAAG